ncbi:MAG: hypothetical protein FVQ80_07140 [Planctomycetes bacterium]|nr:hypothetical protein [Planctomycetota bacterium]
MKVKIFVSFLLVLLVSCATTQQLAPFSPSEDIVILCPVISVPIGIPKGFFDDPDNWMTLEDFNNMLKGTLHTQNEKEG